MLLTQFWHESVSFVLLIDSGLNNKLAVVLVLVEALVDDALASNDIGLTNIWHICDTGKSIWDILEHKWLNFGAITLGVVIWVAGQDYV